MRTVYVVQALFGLIVCAIGTAHMRRLEEQVVAVCPLCKHDPAFQELLRYSDWFWICMAGVVSLVVYGIDWRLKKFKEGRA